MTSSKALFKQAKQHIPGGVNSPVRAFNGVGGEPIFFQRGDGPYLFDTQNKRYIDYVGSWGPMITGHSNPAVISAVQDAIQNGLGFGAPTEIETRMASRLCELIPSMDLVRMVSSGTEATMSAIRLARGYTEKDKLVKFEGCYHGHSDSLLVKAGSGALTLGVPTSAGVPNATAQHTLTLEYNNLDQVTEVFSELGNEIAAIIVEPVAGNMNCVPPAPGFLQGLRAICDQHNSVLIFDEVMTGFRTGINGAQGLYGVTPDITTLGKVIGGGLPVGAFGGKKEIMECIAPLGPVYQAGTLSGNPVALAAGLANLELVSQAGFYEQLDQTAKYLTDNLTAIAREAGVPFTTNQVVGMFGLFFTGLQKIANFEQVCQCDQEQFKKFFHGMLDNGVYFAPSSFEAAFVSSTHTTDVIDATLTAARQVMSTL